MDFAGQDIVAHAASGSNASLDTLLLAWTAEPQAGFDFSQYSLTTPAALDQTLEHTQAMVLAQQFDQDVLGDMGKAWNGFVQSGQIWALAIGLVLGYLIRGLTVY